MNARRHARRRGPSPLSIVLVLVGCRAPASDDTVLVLAASSLTDAFAELERDFEASHPGVDVVVSTGGSQALRVQIEQGVPADVFASANPEHMRAVVAAGHVELDRPLAQGALVIVVPTANPAGIESLADLPRAQRIVLGGDQVPVGIYARAMLDRASARYGEDFRARVDAHVVSLEPNTRQVLAKVELGEADAAIVYRSDAVHSAEVTTIAIPPELDARAEYRIGRLTQAPHAALGEAFIELTLSAAGRAVLVRHGFEAADAS